MERSESIVELAQALSNAQGMIKGAVKDSENPYFHSNYADLASVWEACRVPLSSNGLSVVQITDIEEGKLILKTILLHISGEFYSSKYPITPMKQTQGKGWELSNDPQTMVSAVTYGRRCQISAIVGIAPVEDDDDGNAATGRDKPPIQEPQKKKSPEEPPKKDIETIVTGISTVKEQEKTKPDGKKYLIYGIYVGDDKYGTFSKTFADESRRAAQSGLQCTIEYKTTRYGNEVVSLTVEEPPEDGKTPE